MRSGQESVFVLQSHVLNQFAVVHTSFLKLLYGNQCSLGHSLVVAAYLYLLAVLKDFFQRIVGSGKLLKFLVQFLQLKSWPAATAPDVSRDK